MKLGRALVISRACFRKGGFEMTEYMDIARIDDWNDLSIIDDDGCVKYVYDVGELPRADVVGREKIDKAIEEMDKLAAHKVKPISFDQAVAIDMCIEILKRNTGGANESSKT
jgi:hypothetical protein